MYQQALYSQLFRYFTDSPVYKTILDAIILELSKSDNYFLKIVETGSGVMSNIVKYTDIDEATTKILTTKVRSRQLYDLLFADFNDEFEDLYLDADEDWGTLTDDIIIDEDMEDLYITGERVPTAEYRDIEEDFGSLLDTEVIEEDWTNGDESDDEDWNVDVNKYIVFSESIVLRPIQFDEDWGTWETKSSRLGVEPKNFKECLKRSLRSFSDTPDISGTSTSVTHLLYINGVGCIVSDLFALKGSTELETRVNYQKQSEWVSVPDKEDIGVLGTVLVDCDNSSRVKVSHIEDFYVSDYVMVLGSGFTGDKIRKIISISDEYIYLDDTITYKKGNKINVLRPARWVVNPNEALYYKVPYVDVLIYPTDLYNTRELLPKLRKLIESRLPANVCLRDLQIAGQNIYESIIVGHDSPQLEMEVEQSFTIGLDSYEVGMDNRQIINIQETLTFEELFPDFVVIDDAPYGSLEPPDINTCYLVVMDDILDLPLRKVIAK